MPPGCALLGGFAVGARIALLWQHNANAKCYRVLLAVRLVVICEQRLETAIELIQKDDEARDILGLPKPSLQDFEEIGLKQTLFQKEIATILFNLGIGDDPDDIKVTSKRPLKRG